MKAVIFFFLCTLFTLPTVFGQIKIGDNPQNIDDASVLELESSSKVLVITRVTTAQMETIAPQRGGMVYNTDTACIHYFDGTQWINLCDAVSFTITNDPIINNRSTIKITQSEGGYNLEVAKNSILGDNIVDGGIGPDDIQDNSIGQEKLAAESVGSSELRENSVGSEELRDGTIVPTDIANTDPGRVLTTDENGIVQWEDANEIYELTFNKIDTTLSIIRSTTPGANSVNLAGLIGSDDQILTLTPELMLQIEDGNAIDLSVLNNSGTDEQTLATTNAPGNISISNGNAITLNVNDADADLTNEIQNIEEVLTDGNNAGGNLIKNLGNPIDNQDAVTKAYVDGAITGVGGTIVSTQPNNDISNNGGAFYDDGDNDAANELQDLAFNPLTNILTVTNPGTPDNEADLTSLIQNFQNSGTVTISGDGTIANPYVFDAPGNVANGSETIINEGANITVTGNGTTASPYVIAAADAVGDGSETQLIEGANIAITGIGTDADPYRINADDNQNAAEVTYDNMTSGLAAATTQAAIDELAALPAGSDSQNLTNVLTQGNNAGSNAIIGLAVSLDPTSAATRGYVDANLGGTQDLETVLGNGTSAGSNQINDLADPTLDQDAATKKYVDDNIVAAGGGVPTDELITAFNLNTTTLSITEDGVVWPVNLDTSFATDAELAALSVNDADFDPNNEIELPDDSAANSGDVLATDAAGNYSWITPSLTDTDEQTVDEFQLNAANLLTISLDNDGEVPLTVDLAALEETADITANTTLINNHITNDNDTDDTNEIELPDDSAANSGDVLATDAAGNYSWITPSLTDTDEQTVDEFQLNAANLLTISLDNDGEVPLTVDLAALEETADITANTTLINNHITNDNDTDDTNEIELPDDSAANSGDVLATDAAGNYSWITPSLTDTDEQTVDEFQLNAANLLSISLDNDGEVPLTVDLAALEETADITANTTLINNHITNDNDTDDTNEIELPDDSAANSGDVLATDAAGNYSWITPSLTDTNDFINAGTLNVESLELTGSGGSGATVNLAPFALETEVATAIAASEALDNDTDDTNEIELPDDSAANSGDVLATDAAGNYSWITPSLTDTDEQTVDEFQLNAANLLSISLDNDGEVPLTVDLAALEETADITANTTLINNHITNDNDTDDTNEIELPDDSAANSGDVLATDAAGNYSWITPLIGNNISNADLVQTLGENRTYNLNGSNLFFTGTGLIGIGTVTPEAKFHVSGGQVRAATFSSGDGLFDLPAYRFSDDPNTGMFSPAADQLAFSSEGKEAMRIDTDQNVGIGPGFANIPAPAQPILARLHVDGDIRADGDILYEGDSNDLIPDYVFQKYFLGTSIINDSYLFQSLKEIEDFIKKNHHLPGVISATAAKKEGVWNLSKSNLQNLEKIEELFLHTIEQEKKIKTLQEENRELAKQMDALKSQVAEIKKLLAKGNE